MVDFLQAKYNDPVPTGGGYTYNASEDQSDAEDKVKEDLQGIDSNGDGDYNDAGELLHSFLTIILQRRCCGHQCSAH